MTNNRQTHTVSSLSYMGTWWPFNREHDEKNRGYHHGIPWCILRIHTAATNFYVCFMCFFCSNEWHSTLKQHRFGHHKICRSGSSHGNSHGVFPWLGPVVVGSSPVAGQDLLFRRLGGDGFSKLLDEAEVRELTLSWPWLENPLDR